MDYFIENGVRRAIAALNAGVPKLVAILHESGCAPRKILVALDELHSPKQSISQTDPRYVRALQGMSTPQGRAKMPPIEVQPLGEPGQKATVPLAQVVLDP